MSNEPEQINSENSEPSKPLYYADVIKKIRDRLQDKNLLAESMPNQASKKTTIEVTFINRKKPSQS